MFSIIPVDGAVERKYVDSLLFIITFIFPYNTMTPSHQAPPARLANIMSPSHTHTRARAHTHLVTRGISGVTEMVLPADALLQEKVSFLSLIGFQNSLGGVPLRTHVSLPEVVSDTLNLELSCRGATEGNAWAPLHLTRRR